MAKQIQELENPFEAIIGSYFDKQSDEADVDKLFCNLHKVWYKAIKTNNVCFKYYKNCPYCEAETNYRIALSEYNYAIKQNQWAVSIGRNDLTVEPKPIPDKPLWWNGTKSSGFYPRSFDRTFLRDFKDEGVKQDKDLSRLIDEVTQNDEIDYPF